MKPIPPRPVRPAPVDDVLAKARRQLNEEHGQVPLDRTKNVLRDHPTVEITGAPKRQKNIAMRVFEQRIAERRKRLGLSTPTPEATGAEEAPPPEAPADLLSE